MDSFAEQLLKKKLGGKEGLIIALIWLGVIVLSLLVLLFFPPISILLALLCWGAWWLTQTQFIEYEYSVLNGDLDIDKISGKRMRKRVVQVRASKIDEFLPVTDKLRPEDFQRVLVAAWSKDTATFYVTYNSKKNGRTLVLMEPNARVFKELYNGQPRIKQLALEKACREAGVALPTEQSTEG